jgi:hypothetical protein
MKKINEMTASTAANMAKTNQIPASIRFMEEILMAPVNN